jgi:hypothetical protein
MRPCQHYRRNIFFKNVIVLITIIFTYPASSVKASDSNNNQQNHSHLLRCGYITVDVHKTIFDPNFIIFLSKQQEAYNGISADRLKKMVHEWNTGLDDRRKHITFNQQHFNKFAVLPNGNTDCQNHSCLITHESLSFLIEWMSGITVNPKISQKNVNHIDDFDLEWINIENNKDIDNALRLIARQSVGKRLIYNAIEHYIFIKASQIHHHEGYYDCKHKEIVIDPTVVSYPFKINCIVHELVHAANSRQDNSILEETVAEIIGMKIQDSITQIDISCSHYFVFVTRLIDERYAGLPVRNKIIEDLERTGIIVQFGK